MQHSDLTKPAPRPEHICGSKNVNRNPYGIFLVSAFFFMFVFIIGCQDDRIQFPNVKSSQSEIHLSSEFPTDVFSLSSASTIPMQWSIISKPEWLEALRMSGYAGDGPIAVTAHTSLLLPQVITDKIVIRTTSGELTIPIILTVTSSLAVQIQPAQLLIEHTESSKELTITNMSNQSAVWKIETSAAYLSVSPASGTLAAGASSTLNLAVNRSGLESKAYSERLTLYVSDMKMSETPVTLNNFNDDALWQFDGVIADAEYDRVGDNLIVLTDRRLYKLKPETKSMSWVDLPYSASNVSVSKDGKYAVIPYERAIYKVDLESMEATSSYPLSYYAGDVVAAPNNWVYFYPFYYGWDSVRSVNLSDGTEHPSIGKRVTPFSRGKLHPSGEYIYSVDRGAIDLQKLDIRSGQASLVNNSPMREDVPVYKSDLWFADDGSRMFINNGDVYQLSSDMGSDMIYLRSMEGVIQTLDHSSNANRVAAVYLNTYYQEPMTEVNIYSADLSTKLETKALSSFLVGTTGNYQLVPSEGIHGFFNAAGTKLFVCVRLPSAYSYTGLKWAIATINVD